MSVRIAPKDRRSILAGRVPEWMLRHPRCKRLVVAALAVPPWVLDHIVPLDHPHVCGLTVPWNLQVVPRRVNARKSNRFSPDQLELGLDRPAPQRAFSGF